MNTVFATIAFTTLALVQTAHADHSNKPLEQAAPPAKIEASQRPSMPAERRIQARGMGPVFGMSCDTGYKQIGDDCVQADIEFD